MLCDRVGVIVGGKLAAWARRAPLVDMKTQGMEILFELRGTSNTPLLSRQHAREIVTARLQVSEEELYAAIENNCEQPGVRILSVSQVNSDAGRVFMNLRGGGPRASIRRSEVSGK